MRIAAAIIVTSGLALLATACVASPRSHVAQLGATGTQTGASTSTTQQQGAVAFARCMRSNGVGNWPDPESSGQFDKSQLTLQRLGVSSARLQEAHQACRHLLPNGGPPTQAELRQARAQALSFSRCVRSHGIPNFPDPGSDGRIPDPATVGIDQASPRFQAANQACRRYRPPYLPSNAAYNSWARTHG